MRREGASAPQRALRGSDLQNTVTIWPNLPHQMEEADIAAEFQIAPIVMAMIKRGMELARL